MSLHHLHKRKRMSGKALHAYPATSPGIRFLDFVIKVVAVVSPAMTLPQIILIYKEKNAAGVSPISWLAWTLFNIPWIIYGMVHKEKPLALMYFLWFVTNLAVFIGAVLYGS